MREVPSAVWCRVREGEKMEDETENETLSDFVDGEVKKFRRIVVINKGQVGWLAAAAPRTEDRQLLPLKEYHFATHADIWCRQATVSELQVQETGNE